MVLWKVGTTTKLTLTRAGEAQYPTVSAGPGGRLWVSWIEGSQIRAVRTNPSVTQWGVVRTLTTPAADGEAPTSITGDGQLGPLDAVINVANKPLVKGGNPAPQIFAARIYEGLKVTATRGISYKKGGIVTVTVSDAGLAVPGVKVVVGGKAKTTGSSGKVTFAVAAALGQGRPLGRGERRRLVPRQGLVQGRLAPKGGAEPTRMAGSAPPLRAVHDRGADRSSGRTMDDSLVVRTIASRGYA